MPEFSSISLLGMREHFQYQTTSGALATATNRIIVSSSSQRKTSLLFLQVQADVATRIDIKEGTGTVMSFNVAANVPVFISFPFPGLTHSAHSTTWQIAHSDAGSVNIFTTAMFFRGRLMD